MNGVTRGYRLPHCPVCGSQPSRLFQGFIGKLRMIAHIVRMYIPGNFRLGQLHDTGASAGQERGKSWGKKEAQLKKKHYSNETLRNSVD